MESVDDSFLDRLFALLPSNGDYLRYRQIFELNGISERTACSIDQETLLNLGVSKKLHRSKILKALKSVKKVASFTYKEPEQFFMNLNTLPRTASSQIIESGAILEEHFSQYGKIVEMRLLKVKKLVFLTIQVRTDHIDKFPHIIDRYVNHKILNSTVRVKKARPFDPNHVPASPPKVVGKPITSSELYVGMRVACEWEGVKIPATICAFKEGGSAEIIFDEFQGFKEEVFEKNLFHLEKDPMKIDYQKVEALKYGVPVTCTFGIKRKPATVVSVKNSIVFVKRPDIKHNEPATIFDVRINSGGLHEQIGSVTNIFADQHERYRVEADIIATLEQELANGHVKFVQYGKLIRMCRVPYKRFGYSRLLDFIKSIDEIHIQERKYHLPRVYLNERRLKQSPAASFDGIILEFVCDWIRSHPNQDYCPYNSLVHGLHIPQEQLEAVGHKRLLEYLKEHDKFQVTQHPDARIWLVGDLLS